MEYAVVLDELNDAKNGSGRGEHTHLMNLMEDILKASQGFAVPNMAVALAFQNNMYWNIHTD
jgi:hypothetical protein